MPRSMAHTSWRMYAGMHAYGGARTNGWSIVPVGHIHTGLCTLKGSLHDHAYRDSIGDWCEGNKHNFQNA